MEKMFYYFGSKLVVYLGEKFVWKVFVKERFELRNKYLTDELDDVYSKMIDEHVRDDFVLIDHI